MPKVKTNKPWRCVADNLRILLAVRNMSRDELARRMNTTAVTVGRWIRGENLPQTEDLWRIAEILKTTVPALTSPVNELAENCTRFVC